MTEDPARYGSTPPSKHCVVIDHDSWTLKLYKKQRHLTVEALDYHAGPLMLTRNELIDIARKMGLHVQTRKKKRKSDKEK